MFISIAAFLPLITLLSQVAALPPANSIDLQLGDASHFPQLAGSKLRGPVSIELVEVAQSSAVINLERRRNKSNKSYSYCHSGNAREYRAQGNATYTKDCQALADWCETNPFDYAVTTPYAVALRWQGTCMFTVQHIASNDQLWRIGNKDFARLINMAIRKNDHNGLLEGAGDVTCKSSGDSEIVVHWGIYNPAYWFKSRGEWK